MIQSYRHNVRRTFRACCVVASVVLLVSASQADAQRQSGTAPATKPAPRAGRPVDPANKAVRELVKEAQEALRAGKPLPRTTSDYFKSVDGEKPTEEQVLGQLNRNLHGNPLIEAYVKWQLLSGAPKTFAPVNAEPAVRALVNAPGLPTLPGAVPDVQRKLQDAITRLRPDRDGKLSDEDRQTLDSVNEQLAAETKRIIDETKILIDYRNELTKRIPMADEKQKTLLMRARLEDLWQRGAAGFSTTEAYKALAAEIRTWAATADKDSIGRMISFIGEYSSRQPAKVYNKAAWNSRYKRIYWDTRQAGVETSDLVRLQDDLRETQKNAVGF